MHTWTVIITRNITGTPRKPASALSVYSTTRYINVGGNESILQDLLHSSRIIPNIVVHSITRKIMYLQAEVLNSYELQMHVSHGLKSYRKQLQHKLNQEAIIYERERFQFNLVYLLGNFDIR